MLFFLILKKGNRTSSLPTLLSHSLAHGHEPDFPPCLVTLATSGGPGWQVGGDRKAQKATETPQSQSRTEAGGGERSKLDSKSGWVGGRRAGGKGGRSGGEVQRGCKVEVGGGMEDIARLTAMEWRAGRSRGEGSELILLAEGNKTTQLFEAVSVWGKEHKRRHQSEGKKEDENRCGDLYYWSLS